MNDTTTKQILVARHSPGYWRVTINHPPLNIFGPDTIPPFNEAITAIETDEQVKVVVFDSAVPGFFLTHYDFLAKAFRKPRESNFVALRSRRRYRARRRSNGTATAPDGTRPRIGSAFGC